MEQFPSQAPQQAANRYTAPDRPPTSTWPASSFSSDSGILPSGPAPLDTLGALQPPPLESVLLQEPISFESWSIAKAIRAASLDVQIHRVTTSNVMAYADLLRAGRCTPVGNPDFMRAAMRVSGIAEPAWTCYPRALAAHMLQQPRRTQASRALASEQAVFVKPTSGRHFRGFVLGTDRAALNAYASRQLERLLDRPRTELVWVAAPLLIVSEWRYYVRQGEVVGYAKVDHSTTGRAPHLQDISAIIAALPLDCAYALDVAVLASGQVTVLGARDAWALELLPFGDETPDVLDFLRMLWLRWGSLWIQAGAAEGQC